MLWAVVALTLPEVLLHTMTGGGALLRTGDDAAFLDRAAAVVQEDVDGTHDSGGIEERRGLCKKKSRSIRYIALKACED